MSRFKITFKTQDSVLIDPKDFETTRDRFVSLIKKIFEASRSSEFVEKKSISRPYSVSFYYGKNFSLSRSRRLSSNRKPEMAAIIGPEVVIRFSTPFEKVKYAFIEGLDRLVSKKKLSFSISGREFKYSNFGIERLFLKKDSEGRIGLRSLSPILFLKDSSESKSFYERSFVVRDREEFEKYLNESFKKRLSQIKENFGLDLKFRPLKVLEFQFEREIRIPRHGASVRTFHAKMFFEPTDEESLINLSLLGFGYGCGYGFGYVVNS